jgi:hypothetical protein
MGDSLSDNNLQPEKPKKSIEDYRIPETNMINWSRYLRENTVYPPPSHKIGDVVVLTVIGEVTEVYKDCDGSTLYEIDGTIRGYPESSVRAATDEEKENF